jgi:putative sterol carrier protein
MTIYQDTEELHNVMRNLWQDIAADEKIAQQLAESKLIVQFNYSDPVGTVTLDCTDGQKCHVSVGSTTVQPTIQMSMKADTAHEFWMGRINVPMALLSGKIVSRGPTASALKLLPLIKSVFPIYPQVLKKLGKEKLLSQ